MHVRQRILLTEAALTREVTVCGKLSESSYLREA